MVPAVWLLHRLCCDMLGKSLAKWRIEVLLLDALLTVQVSNAAGVPFKHAAACYERSLLFSGLESAPVLAAYGI